jgi:hypothetical protein
MTLPWTADFEAYVVKLVYGRHHGGGGGWEWACALAQMM